MYCRLKYFLVWLNSKKGLSNDATVIFVYFFIPLWRVLISFDLISYKISEFQQITEILSVWSVQDLKMKLFAYAKQDLNYRQRVNTQNNRSTFFSLKLNSIKLNFRKSIRHTVQYIYFQNVKHVGNIRIPILYNVKYLTQCEASTSYQRHARKRSRESWFRPGVCISKSYPWSDREYPAD